MSIFTNTYLNRRLMNRPNFCGAGVGNWGEMGRKLGRKNDAEKIFFDEKEGRVRARGTFILVDGSKKRFEARGDTREEAEEGVREKVRRENHRIMYGSPELSEDTSLAAAVRILIDQRREEYDRAKGRKARREVSIMRDEDVLKALIEPHSISKLPISKVFIRDAEAWRDWLQGAQHPERAGERFYSASSLNRALRLVRGALDRFYRHSDRKSPGEILEPFKQTVRKKTAEDFLVGEEVEVFMKFLSQKWKHPSRVTDRIYIDIVMMTIMTAARPGELRGLKKKDWDSQARELSIRRTGEHEDGRTKTAESIRVIPVIGPAAEILDRLAEKRKPGEYLFSLDGKKPLSKYTGSRVVKRWVREAGIDKDLHWHSLRGSGGSYMLDQGMRIEDVSVLMGHASITTTERHYTWHTTRRKRESVQVMENAFSI